MCLNIWYHSFQELHDSLFLIDSIQNESEIILVNVLEIFSYKNKPHSRIVCPKFDIVILSVFSISNQKVSMKLKNQVFLLCMNVW